MSAPAPILPPARIGIIGGGQLGRMTAQKAKRLGFQVVVLDPYPQAPAGQLADKQIVGSFTDPERIRELVEQCALATYDIEHIDAEALQQLESEGHAIRPSGKLLALVQDKLRQRDLYAKAGLPQPEYVQCDEPGAEAFEKFGYPLVQKSRKGGYDGRGVAIIKGPEDLPNLLPVPSLLERKVDIEKELAVVVARGLDGSIAAYPLVEMEVDPEANLLDLLLAPARVHPDVAKRAEEIAIAVVEALGGAGVFGVELFLSTDGELLVNEVAPRPHNSGHFTYEATMTSQFEQHLRAVAGLPLGSTHQYLPAAMVNLLGAPGESGPAAYEGVDEALAVPGALVHIYGKAETRPFRKMGHVTVMNEDLQAARAAAIEIRDKIRIYAQKEESGE